MSITAPNHLHREVALAAATAGKHFWCEKPVGRSASETAAVAAAAESAGVRTIVGFNYRQAPAVQNAARLISTGALGQVRQYRSQFVAGYAANPQGALSCRFLRSFAGQGVLGDLMSHAADLAQFLLGPIDRVVAHVETTIGERPRASMGEGTHFAVVEGGELSPVENEDTVLSLVHFESGVTGTIEASRVTVGPQARYAFEVNGQRGAVAWDFERLNELLVYLPLEIGDSGYSQIMMGPKHPPYGNFQPGAALAMGYDDLKVIEAALLLDSVVDGVQREPGVREALAAAQVLEAMERSGASGAWEPV